ncbi:helix-turn-helix transcriptional regulator [Castellaniella defragrans]|uniref:AraC family transcriptional activator of pyochelin receptor n=1 Tax=Castellaniella defragrans TaxID=75697 RepID=A0A7W9TM63_CASDE|nr:AraC family transcriptional regulator [Castellaniella defragrans]KAB0612192.1 helix-turn-helix transcriptional regulator [Castellaniella defragrans]MBB6082756.1 AraC family transcriptional activator of pyochelin receptor [Castellaniella defragrans]
MQPSQWSRRFSADMTMSAGSVVLEDALEVTAPVFEGLQVIVSLNSRLRSRVNGRAPFEIAEPGAYLVVASGRHEGYDRLEPGTLQQFVRVGIEAGSAARHGFDLHRIARSGCRRLYGEDITVLHRPLTPALKAIAIQALICPFGGTMRDVYLAGKGLELAAVALEGLADGNDARKRRLTGADTERLWYARELAVRHHQEPLTLHELARRAGINVNKLNAGFQQLFGMSVFQYVQDHRLKQAYQMLSTGTYSVSEVAAFVGYAIPHFSVLFRKRFGFSPKQLKN